MTMRCPLFMVGSFSPYEKSCIQHITHLGIPATPTAASGHAAVPRARSSLFKSIFRFGRRREAEGIIAPRTPIMQSPPTPGLGGIHSLNNRPSRPSSPLLGPGIQRTDSPTLSPNFALQPPPRRGTSPTVLGDRPGFGLRRVASASAANSLDGL